MTDAAASPPQKQPRGRPFPKGRSANPAGKRPGTRSRVTMFAEKLMQDDAGEVVRAVVAKAKDGDMIAARLVLERIAPPRKGSPVKFKLPPMHVASDLVAALGALLEATSKGDVTPEEAAVIAGVLDAQRKAIEVTDIEARLAAVETQLDAGKK